MKVSIKKEKIILLLKIVSLVILDQLLKKIIFTNKQILPIQLIDGIFKINYIENFGIAFGMAKGGLVAFIIINIIIIGIVITLLFIKDKNLNKINKDCCILISAGGIGNLIDRIFRGYVIDYIDFSQIINFPIFNFADIMIVIGTLFIVFFMILDIIKK